MANQNKNKIKKYKKVVEKSKFWPIVKLFKNRDKFMQNVFIKHNPDILFHASAYKHVTLLEENQIEAVKNNI